MKNRDFVTVRSQRNIKREIVRDDRAMNNHIFDVRMEDLRWLTDDATDPNDLCAHARFTVRVFDSTLLTPADGEWNCFAAVAQMVASAVPTYKNPEPHWCQMIPCCGHSYFFNAKTKEYSFICCNTGFHWQVNRADSRVNLSDFAAVSESLSKARQWTLAAELTLREYRAAILPLVQTLREFYVKAARLNPPPEREETPAFTGIWQMLDAFTAAENGSSISLP